MGGTWGLRTYRPALTVRRQETKVLDYFGLTGNDTRWAPVVVNHV